jgi:hypothetical protein
MTISGFLPRRWRPSEEAARHAEAIAGILNTRPLHPTTGGPAIASLFGAADVLPYLVAVKSLRHKLGRGGIVIIDDGTLTGEDRAILAHHCGDPEILPHQTVRAGAFPVGGEWAQLLTILDRRTGRYWIALDPRTVTLGDLPEVNAAVASNRSFTLLGSRAGGGRARQIERKVAVLCGTRGWRYHTGCTGLTGFAAGGAGRALAAAFHEEAAAIGESATADWTRNVILANETEPVLLPRDRYRPVAGPSSLTDAAVVHFTKGPAEGEPYAVASCRAIAQLPV